MGILNKLAVIITGKAVDAVKALEETASAADRAALAEARLATAVANEQRALAKQELELAKTANETDRLTAANERYKVASRTLAETKAAEGVAKTRIQVASAQKEMQGLEQSTTGLQKTLGGLGTSGGLAAGGLGAIATAGAAAELAIGGMAIKAVDAAAELGEQVTQFERLSGATADQASRLLYASKQLGLESDTTATALLRLGHNTEGSTDKLGKLGVEVVRLKNGQVDLLATLENVAQAYQNAGGGAKGTEIAYAAFGRSAKDLLPLLAKNREELHKLFAETPKSELVSDAEQARDRQFKEDIHHLTEEMKALEIAGGKALLPFFDNAVSNFSRLAKVAEKVFGPIERFLDRIGISVSSTKDLGKAADTTGSQIDGMAGSLDGAAKSADDYTTALSDGVSAIQSLESADQRVAASQKALTEAQGAGARQARDIADATRSVDTATRSVRDAEEQLNEARRQAPRDLAKAREDEASGIHKIADAEDDLAAAIARYGSESRQAADAADKLASAKQSHADAADKLAELQKNPNKSVQDAESRLADAKRSQLDSQEKLNKAKAEDPAAEVAKAEQDARDAAIARQQAYDKLVQLGATINTALGTTVDLTDTSAKNLNSIVDQLLRAQSLAAQPFNPSANPTPSARGGGPDGGGSAPAIGTQINVNVETNASPTEIAQAIDWASRTRRNF